MWQTKGKKQRKAGEARKGYLTYLVHICNIHALVDRYEEPPTDYLPR